MTRLRLDPESRDYAARRLAEGKSMREVRRCLKRYVARESFRTFEGSADRLTVAVVPSSRTDAVGVDVGWNVAVDQV